MNKKCQTARNIVLSLFILSLSGCGASSSLQPGEGQVVPGKAPTITPPPPPPPAYTPSFTPSAQPTYTKPKITETKKLAQNAMAVEGMWAPEKAKKQLKQMIVAEPMAPYAYNPESYGDWGSKAKQLGWSGDKIEETCDVLTAATIRQASSLGDWSQQDCTISSGNWYDPYSGNVITMSGGRFSSPETLQPDRIVPLFEASKSGALAFDAEKKAKFANDPINTIMASNTKIGGKNNRGIDKWQPMESSQCGYAIRWVQVKAKYGMFISGGLPEKEKIEQMLNKC